MAGYKGAPPPTPSLRVPLKWAKSLRSSGVRSLSLGAEMGSKGGLAERAGGTGIGGWRKWVQILSYLPQSCGYVSYGSQIPQSCRLKLGGVRGCLEREWRERGVPSPPSRGFGAREQGGPLPQSQAQAALSLRTWTGQHSCGPGSPLPPACLNLDPASGDPAPPPPTGIGLGEAAREGPALRVGGGLP